MVVNKQRLINHIKQYIRTKVIKDDDVSKLPADLEGLVLCIPLTDKDIHRVLGTSRKHLDTLLEASERIHVIDGVTLVMVRKPQLQVFVGTLLNEPEDFTEALIKFAA